MWGQWPSWKTTRRFIPCLRRVYNLDILWYMFNWANGGCKLQVKQWKRTVGPFMAPHLDSDPFNDSMTHPHNLPQNITMGGDKSSLERWTEHVHVRYEKTHCLADLQGKPGDTFIPIEKQHMLYYSWTFKNYTAWHGGVLNSRVDSKLSPKPMGSFPHLPLPPIPPDLCQWRHWRHFAALSLNGW